MIKTTASYNERLFSGGIRTWLHEMRFRWLREETKGMVGSVFELGCFDARSLAFLAFTPTDYLGIDAGWEGGLDAAVERYPQYECRRSHHQVSSPGEFDVAIALETLEHLPRGELPAYIDMLSTTAPVLLATVPVEIGPVFLAKHAAKLAVGTNEKYSFFEAAYATCGMSRRVQQEQHKGFDYRDLVRLIKSRYRYVTVRGLPIALAPMLSFTVAIRA